MQKPPLKHSLEGAALWAAGVYALIAFAGITLMIYRFVHTGWAFK